jgi:hypothetical protein
MKRRGDAQRLHGGEMQSRVYVVDSRALALNHLISISIDRGNGV